MNKMKNSCPSSRQFPAGEQRGAARRRLSHLPVGGEGADQTLQGPQLFSSGGGISEAHKVRAKRASTAFICHLKYIYMFK